MSDAEGSMEGGDVSKSEASDSASDWENVAGREEAQDATESAEKEADEPYEFRPVITPTREKRPLVHYAYLPRWEFMFYVAVCFFLFTYMWYLIGNLSHQLHNKYGIWRAFRTYGRMQRVEHPVFGPRLRDASNYEWNYYRELLPRLVGGFVLHSVMFNCVDYVVSSDRPLVVQLVRTALSVPINMLVYGCINVLMVIPMGIALYTITRVTKSQLVMWVSILPVMYTLMHSTELFVGEEDPFTPMMLASYKCLMYISYCIEFIRGNVPRESKQSYTRVRMGLLRMFYFSFYMPFGASVIVTYAQFEQQLIERKNIKRNPRALIWLAVRLIFWYHFIETILHFLYFEMILRSERTLRKIRLDELTVMGAAIGQFFHLKYVVIFGVPRLFAKLDGMQPPEGPICTSRVVLFSNIWRGFDRGLYNFFKEYIFLPICRPTFSVWRKMLGVALAYTFVLHWHGYTRSHVVWIFFNVCELAQEATAKTIYSIPAVRQWREAHVSDVCFRRIIALLQVCPYAFSLYSNFYFLGGGRSGWVFVDRVFWGETVTFQYPFPLLVVCGYCFTNVIMTLEQYLYDREHPEVQEEKPLVVDGGKSKED